ncbi:MAG: hypothetical protein RLN62_01470 [Rickettsiales bacterium]
MLKKYENPAVKSAREAKEELVAELGYIREAHEEMKRWDEQWAKTTAEGPDKILAEFAEIEANSSHITNLTGIGFCSTEILGIAQESCEAL